ncbi:hypothetical protein GCM10023192_71970 [Amycolatopsis samaneae]
MSGEQIADWVVQRRHPGGDQEFERPRAIGHDAESNQDKGDQPRSTHQHTLGDPGTCDTD